MSTPDSVATPGTLVYHSGPASGLMLRARWLFVGFAFGFVVALASGFGKSGRGPAEEIGQAVDKATHSASTWVGSTVGSGRPADSDLASQVDVRLDSDKGLDSSKVEVRPGTDGAVELHGVVATADAKDRAVSLARDTRGVRRVVDQLAVAPRPRVVNSSSDEPASSDPSGSTTTTIPGDPAPRVIRAARSTSRTPKSVE